MVRIRRLSDYPNVLVVTGREIRHDSYRDDLKEELLDRESSKVHRGTHNFWITWFTPTTAGGEYDGGDLSTSPHKLRGVIRMGALAGDTSVDNVQGQIRTMLEEVGHHWLVPTNLQFNNGGTRQPLVNTTVWTRNINDGTPLGGLPLLGRDEGGHWSSYLQADKSPMDGQWWTDERRDGRMTAWTNRALNGPMYAPSGLTDVQLTAQYSDLDLAIIGKITRAAAYADQENQTHWIEPRFMSPLPYHAGICVCFRRGKLIQFGFDQDQHTLGVYRSGGAGGVLERQVQPARFPQVPFGIALRVVREGDEYHFQVRADEAAGAHIAPEPRDIPGGAASAPRIRGLFDEIDHVPPATSTPNLASWSTIASVTESDAPQAIGLIVDKWDHPSFVRAAFFNLEVRAGGQDTVHAFRGVPATIAASTAYDRIPSEPRLDLPAPDADIRIRGRNVLVMTTPFSVVRGNGTLEHLGDFGHTTTADRAPKVLLHAPSGDFAFGTSALLLQTAATPWAGGYLRDKVVWGTKHPLRVRDAVFSSSINDIRLSRDRVSTLRCAFILAATNDSDVTDAMVERVDILRRYWDAALPLASRGLLKSRSVL